jgi:hypothetical protein
MTTSNPTESIARLLGDRGPRTESDTPPASFGGASEGMVTVADPASAAGRIVRISARLARAGETARRGASSARAGGAATIAPTTQPATTTDRMPPANLSKRPNATPLFEFTHRIVFSLPGDSRTK